MEEAYSAIHKVLNHEIYLVLILLFGLSICIFIPKKSERKKKKAALLGAVILFILVAYIPTRMAPVLKDCCTNNIIVVHGLYRNLLGDRKNTLSAKNGVYSVTVEVNGQEIHLTTAPWCKDVFLQGEYEVKAYYLPNARRLLYIELQ